MDEAQAHTPLDAGRANPYENPWHLLLQIDTDSAPDTDWGDTGRIYFLMREADLMRRDFSGVWAILQCT